MMTSNDPSEQARAAIAIPVDGLAIQGDLTLPTNALGLVIFCHGSGSSRHSPRNREVAEALNAVGLGTLLIDLLTVQEERVDLRTRHLRFDIDLLAGRVVRAVEWAQEDARTSALPIGLFGSSTGAAAALVAAAQAPEAVRAVVSRGGRPDLADEALADVRAPTLLIVGGADTQVIALNRQAQERLNSSTELTLVPNATHLFEEPGALEQVSQLAGEWFRQHLAANAG